MCVARILDREAGSQLITVHAKDLAMLQLEFEGTQLRRRIGSPNIHMVLEYSEKTGVARTLIRGGSKYHDMLAQAFTRHLLGVEITAQRIKLPTLDLSALKLGFQVPQAMTDGFVTLQVKSLTMLSPSGKLKTEFSATASSDHQCVTELIAEDFPNDKRWAESAGEFVGTQKRLAELLLSRGVNKWRNSSGLRGFQGIGLRFPSEYRDNRFPEND